MCEKGNDMKQSSEFIHALMQKQLRKKLRKIRLDMNCSIEQLSCRSGIGLDTLSAIAEGKEEITPDILGKILDVFNYFDEEKFLYKQKIC